MLSCYVAIAQAVSYKYLVVETIDGTVHFMEATGLSITFSDGNLVASDGTSITSGQLTKMYFSNESSVEELLAAALQGDITAYTPSGEKVGVYQSVSDLKASLKHGLFIMKDRKGNTAKITLR